MASIGGLSLAGELALGYVAATPVPFRVGYFDVPLSIANLIEDASSTTVDLADLLTSVIARIGTAAIAVPSRLTTVAVA